MSGKEDTRQISRRHFLGQSAIAGGAVLGAGGLGLSWHARVSAAAGVAAGTQGPQSLEFVPGEIVVATSAAIQTVNAANVLAKSELVNPILKRDRYWPELNLTLQATQIWNIGSGKCRTAILYSLVRSSPYPTPSPVPGMSPQEWYGLQDALRTLIPLQIYASLHPMWPLCGAYPNWTIAAAPDSFVQGGPGGTEGANRPKVTYAFPTLVLGPKKRAPQIIVLDTFPRGFEKDAALLATIGASYGNMDDFAHDTKVAEVLPCSPVAHHQMENHGPFVTSLIHQIYPEHSGPITIMRVLNDFGGGKESQLYDAFTHISPLVASYSGPTIINMSLVSSANMLTSGSLKDQYLINPGEYQLPAHHDKQGPDRVYGDDQEAGAILKGILSGAQTRAGGSKSVIMLAAAGNNGNRLNNPSFKGNRSPRVPAQFIDNVISVAAVNSKGQPAQYSNVASDLSNSNGIATFGGDSSSCGAANNDPIVGFFPQSGTTNYRQWQGTSFATALMSGLVGTYLAQIPLDPSNGRAWTPENLVAALVAAMQAATQGSPNKMPVNVAFLRCTALLPYIDGK